MDTAKFKEQCLWLLDHLGPEGVIVTKHGKPVAKVIPIEGSCADLIGSLKDKLKPKGDLLSTGIRWDAESDTHILIHALGGRNACQQSKGFETS